MKFKFILIFIFGVLFFSNLFLVSALCVNYNNNGDVVPWCCDNSDYIPILIIDENLGYCCPSFLPELSVDLQFCLEPLDDVCITSFEKSLYSSFLDDIYKNYDVYECDFPLVCTKILPSGSSGGNGFFDFNFCTIDSSTVISNPVSETVGDSTSDFFLVRFFRWFFNLFDSASLTRLDFSPRGGGLL